ncbi:MAG TPA: zf-HC2 domain-containing protein, partial [Ktedonobacterales bacterium]|nr:zf-HC2 domain-containing protein [Ktedonobacterales bacterium]
MIGGNGREHADREVLRERLSAYLDGELAPGDDAALERHLATCAECRDELAGLREVRALLRALPQPALPRSFALPATTGVAQIPAG